MMCLWSPTDGHLPGAFFGLRIPDRSGGQDRLNASRIPVLVPHSEEDIMDKWKIVADSKIARVGASAATLIAVAAVVGAGWKWN